MYCHILWDYFVIWIIIIVIIAIMIAKSLFLITKRWISISRRSIINTTLKIWRILFIFCLRTHKLLKCTVPEGSKRILKLNWLITFLSWLIRIIVKLSYHSIILLTIVISKWKSLLPLYLRCSICIRLKPRFVRGKNWSVLLNILNRSIMYRRLWSLFSQWWNTISRLAMNFDGRFASIFFMN